MSDAALPSSGTVGVIVNPVAGKDIRRLTGGAAHTPDTTKIGIVHRAIVGAIESGARSIVGADDPHRLGRRAAESIEVVGADGLPVDIEFLSGHVVGGRDDTVAAAAEMRRRGVDVVIALGGDGTCRDVATGWPDVPLIAISTGTNNVYPRALDATTAGVAAGLVASGSVERERVAQPTKRIVVRLDGAERTEDVALVDLALVEGSFVGARAVSDPGAVRSILAAVAETATTGLSSVAGRAAPLDRHSRGGVEIMLVPPADDVRCIRVPLSPGRFESVGIEHVRRLVDGEPVEWHGPGVLAFDGERDLPIGPDATVVAHVERTGPVLIDVESAVTIAALDGRFDRPTPCVAASGASVSREGDPHAR